MVKVSTSLTASELGSFALAVAIGTVGGALFAWFELPLAWMIGAMCLTTASALAGARITVPKAPRMCMIGVLGTMLGSAFQPATLEHVGQWLVSLSILALYVAAAAGLVTYYFRRVAGYDRTTAYFSAIPGGLAEMIVVGGAMGGDDRTIALTHASRILLVVSIIPFWFRLVEGYQPAPGGAAAGFAAVMAADLLVLALCGAAGFLAARMVKLPSPALIGPLILSAAAHLSGLTDAKLPGEVVIVAQVVLGTGIGCRFAGVPVKRVVRTIVIAMGSTGLMLGVGVVFALAINAVTGLGVDSLVLAFAPGGLAEMSLIALALGIEPAFVSTHHMVRILLVVLAAPLAAKVLIGARSRRPEDPPAKKG